jgi:hypothetical protein
MTTRRLAAILAADVVGFSKLVGEDEAGTLAALREIRKGIVNPVLAADQAEQSWKAITACEVCSRCDCASALRGSARRELAATDLDLRRTKPPIREIIADFEKVYAESPIMYVVEVHERLAPDPLAALRAGFEWSELSIYDLAGPTGRHGVLLGTRRWRALAVGVLPHADGWLKDTGWRGQGRA